MTNEGPNNCLKTIHIKNCEFCACFSLSYCKKLKSFITISKILNFVSSTYFPSIFRLRMDFTFTRFKNMLCNSFFKIPLAHTQFFIWKSFFFFFFSWGSFKLYLKLTINYQITQQLVLESLLNCLLSISSGLRSAA
jgi:hypothetical protein